MKKFRQIDLFLDGGYNNDERKRFVFKSRCICSYLERFLKDLNFDSDLSRLNIYCSRKGREAVSKSKGVPILEAHMNYDMPPIEDLDLPLLQEHCTEIILSGMKLAASYMPVPLDYSGNVLKKFKDSGYKNEWTHASKTWRRLSLRCDIISEITVDKFMLWRKIYKNGDLIDGELLVETLPREILFAGYLGSLRMDDKGRIVYVTKEGEFKFNTGS